MNNINYQQLNIRKIIFQYIRLRGFIESANLISDKHIAEYNIVRDEIGRRGYRIQEKGTQVEFVMCR